MDAHEKLSLFAEQMALEPAEEADAGARRPKRIPLDVPVRAGGSAANGAGKAPPLPCGLDRPPSAPAGGSRRDQPGTQGSSPLPIYHAAVSGGRTLPMLKTLLTSACERNCYYCPFRAGRNYRRVTFKPEEMAKTFAEMQRAGLVEGLFLSSGIIKGGVATQDRILETAEILRHRIGFRGYLHLKIMPGAERAQVERAMALADRISVNLEAPNTRRLQRLAPIKQFTEELLQPLRWAEEIRRTRPAREGWNGRWPSTVTQFVVGAAGESDLELLQTAEYLYNRLHLRRTYFSAFRPITGTPLEEQPAESAWREHRLYQAGFLLRDYDFTMEEMPFDGEGRLPLDVDPKLGWARAHLAEAPVEVNRASREELLRLPGVGVKGAEAILRARRRGRLRELDDLRRVGVVTTRLAPFVLLDGAQPARQLSLFGW
ncbi:MAG: radical SAM protein [Candidatus Promineifilaceae bacterium]|nr:radical SAM protein [Candidatus Promineifilaceae bacterium]